MAVIAVFSYKDRPGRFGDFMAKLQQAAGPEFQSPVMPRVVRLLRNAVPGPDTTSLILPIEYDDMAAYGARTAWEIGNPAWLELFAARPDSPEELESVHCSSSSEARRATRPPPRSVHLGFHRGHGRASGQHPFQPLAEPLQRIAHVGVLQQAALAQEVLVAAQHVCTSSDSSPKLCPALKVNSLRLTRSVSWMASTAPLSTSTVRAGTTAGAASRGPLHRLPLSGGRTAAGCADGWAPASSMPRSRSPCSTA